jgi:hypothetical protein
MRFHLPSFALGFGAGAASATVVRGVRPLLVALGTAIVRGMDSLAAHMATLQEDVDDLVAESRARAYTRSRVPSRSHARARPRRARGRADGAIDVDVR